MSSPRAHFSHLVNLADAALGAEALGTNDDFFASMSNLLRSRPAEFDPDAYGDHGKIMDGWESRRKRGPGHDWCIVRLGCAGRVRLFDIDTAHFLGNHPPFASVDGTHAESHATADELEQSTWTPLLRQVPLRPGSQNVFVAAANDEVWTHLRLNIFPDGGVARFRAYGDVEPAWTQTHVDIDAAAFMQPGEHDLAGIVNGGMALACSDSFFGPMNNLLLPERAVNMGGGWETRRRRGPGSDWIIVRLGAVGEVGGIEIDTNHFKGNFPDTAMVEGVHAPEAELTELVDPGREWASLVPPTKLEAHHRHFLRDEIEAVGPVSHIRLTIVPDGGVSRLRVFGVPEGHEATPAGDLVT